MAKTKTPKTAAKLQPVRKDPRTSPGALNWASSRFCWRTNRADLSGPFGWNALTLDQLLTYVIPKLHEIETSTWGELQKGSKHYHTCEVAKFSKEARDRMRELGEDDLDELFCMHLTNREIVWGIKDRQIVYLLWWDPEHKVCPSPKKHT